MAKVTDPPFPKLRLPTNDEWRKLIQWLTDNRIIQGLGTTVSDAPGGGKRIDVNPSAFINSGSHKQPYTLGANSGTSHPTPFDDTWERDNPPIYMGTQTDGVRGDLITSYADSMEYVIFGRTVNYDSNGCVYKIEAETVILNIPVT